MTYKQFIDDIRVALGMAHDDALWTRDNILQNTLYCLYKLNVQNLTADTGKASDGRAASAMESIAIVPVTHVETPGNDEWSYCYIDLPSAVYDLPFDRGIRFIRYHRPSLPANCKPSIAGATFTGINLGSLAAHFGSSYQNPREDRPYYARAKEGDLDRVHLFGVNPLVSNVLVGMLAYTKFIDVDFDDDLPIDPAKLFTLKNMVLDMSVWPLAIPQERLKNDGRDFEPNQVINTRPAISVNNPAVLEQPTMPE